MILLIAFSFLAGLATVLSPCVLPVLPAILSAGASGGRLRPLGLILGFIVSFAFFTLALTSLVQLFGLSANALRYIAIIIIGFFGLVMLIPSLSDRFAWFTSSVADLGAKIQSHSLQSGQSGFFSGVILGLALGLVWTPCAGPILASITTLVATQHVTSNTVILTFAYTLGAAIPLLILAYGGKWAIRRSPAIAKHAEGLRQIFGGIMLLTALALAFNWDFWFQEWVVNYIPAVQVENNPLVQEELKKLRTSSGKGLASSAAGQSSEDKTLPVIAAAPELVGITKWINSNPLTLKELRGKVVLVDFWTYSCINCIRTFPYLRDWYEKYKDKGLVIIGVHTPEFEFEKNYDNVKRAVDSFRLDYPIALDNNYKTWQAFDNSYWPADYLIDQKGMLRAAHFGEGDYTEMENNIRSLLNEVPISNQIEKKRESQKAQIYKTYGMTPEIYLGYKKAKNYAEDVKIERNQPANYSYKPPLKNDEVGLRGAWTIEAERAISQSNDSFLDLNFTAARVHLVLGGSSSQPVQVFIDGKPLPKEYRTADMNVKGEIVVTEPRKYDVINLQEDHERHVLTLQIPKGIEVYAFTFGLE